LTEALTESVLSNASTSFESFQPVPETIEMALRNDHAIVCNSLPHQGKQRDCGGRIKVFIDVVAESAPSIAGNQAASRNMFEK
jgi:hypothetical protein